MDDAELNKLARQLYDTSESRPHSPPWDQLGDVTKGVWRDYVKAGVLPKESS